MRASWNWINYVPQQADLRLPYLFIWHLGCCLLYSSFWPLLWTFSWFPSQLANNFPRSELSSGDIVEYCIYMKKLKLKDKSWKTPKRPLSWQRGHVIRPKNVVIYCLVAWDRVFLFFTFAWHTLSLWRCRGPSCVKLNFTLNAPKTVL